MSVPGTGAGSSGSYLLLSAGSWDEAVLLHLKFQHLEGSKHEASTLYVPGGLVGPCTAHRSVWPPGRAGLTRVLPACARAGLG